MRRRLSWGHLAVVFSIVVLLCGLGHKAIAAPVAFGFTGTVTEVFDGLGALKDQVAPRMPFAGAYVFESTTPNTGFVGEGEAGLYHHDRPLAGVFVAVDGMAFLSNFLHPDFDIIVNNDFGFVGSDDYGFESRNNRWIGLRPDAPVDALNIRWFASTAPLHGTVFDSVKLPLDPPSLRELGGGIFTIYGECSRCAGPAAFFRIEGTLTSLFKIFPPGDMNGDGQIDRRDIADVVQYLGTGDHPPLTNGDADGDGAITLVDLSLAQAGLATAILPATAAPVPEPATVVLALAGLAWAFVRAGRMRR